MKWRKTKVANMWIIFEETCDTVMEWEEKKPVAIFPSEGLAQDYIKHMEAARDPFAKPFPSYTIEAAPYYVSVYNAPKLVPWWSKTLYAEGMPSTVTRQGLKDRYEQLAVSSTQDRKVLQEAFKRAYDAISK